MNRPQAAVTLSGAGKTFSTGTTALAPTSLEIFTGSFVSIVGPSGCGKSTLLRLIAGLLPATTGRVECQIGGAPGQIGFVFQSATLMPWANCTENVALPLRLSRQPDNAVADRIEEVLARVGLKDFAASYPHELSGGMQMRASIARAIVTNPQLLLMDEPFAALDEFTRFRLNDDLRAMWKAQRWTVVFVTHSIREAVFLAERVIVMSPGPGRVVADLNIELPQERDEGLRDKHSFSDQCARVGAALAAARQAA